MTCREVMTADPVCCLPNDTAARAAQIMRAENVGPVPVVEGQHDKRLLGIVTDRDLAIKVVSEGRDPNTTTVEGIMTRNPVTCHPDDDLQSAMESMSAHQIRRIPIVGSDGRLEGIIAQADVARIGDDEIVGELVEEISEPEGMGRSIGSRGYMYRSEMSAAGGLLLGACCMAFGAGLMFLMDPNRGRTRRARVRDKAFRYYNKSGEFVRKTQRDITNRAQGIAAQARGLGRNEEVPDEKLVARARSIMGRIVSHPHAIRISAEGGYLRVEGPILAHEANGLIRAMESMTGISGVDNMLELHRERDIPDLQGGIERPGQRMEFMQRNWSPSARVVAGAIGGGLAAYGLASRTPGAICCGAIGLGLLARGVTNKEMTSIAPLDRLRGGMESSREQERESAEVY